MEKINNCAKGNFESKQGEDGFRENYARNEKTYAFKHVQLHQSKEPREMS